LNDKILLLNKAWNPIQPMDDLFAQIDGWIEFAKHVNPISSATLLRSAHTNIKNTGLFDADIRDWNKLEPAAQAMKAFKTAFLRANKYRRLKTPSTTAAGYHHAVAVITTPVVTRRSIDLSVAPSFYCWIQGKGRNHTHTSVTCSNLHTGHCKAATLANRLGGCPNIQNMKRERTTWKGPERPDTSGKRIRYSVCYHEVNRTEY
jgi:hypothetical protein